MYPSNIKFREHEGDLPIGVDDKLWLVIDPLTIQYPTFEFREHYTRHKYKQDEKGRDVIAGIVVTEFYVYSGDERIGAIGIQTYGSRRVYLANDRISSALDRRNSMQTGDVKKAIKLFKKYFFAKNEMERIKDHVGEAKRKLENFASDKGYRVRNLYSEMRDGALAYIANTLPDFQKFIDGKQFSIRNEVINSISTVLDEASEAEGMLDRFDNNNMLLVLTEEHADKYIVTNKEATEVDIKFRDDLHTDIIRDVGMLKLVEVGQAIFGVGLRVGEKAFIVNRPNTVRS